MAAIMRNLPNQLTKDLALELKKVKSIDDIHNTVNIYMYDHQAGQLWMPVRRQHSPQAMVLSSHPRAGNGLTDFLQVQLWLFGLAACQMAVAACRTGMELAPLSLRLQRYQ